MLRFLEDVFEGLYVGEEERADAFGPGDGGEAFDGAVVFGEGARGVEEVF